MKLAWAFLSFLLIAPAQKPTASLIDSARAMEGRSAYGVFIAGKRVGYEIEDQKLILWEGRPALMGMTESVLDIKIEGVRNRVVSREVTVNSLEGNGPVVFFSAKTDESGEKVEREANENGKGGLRITTRRRGRVEKRDIPFPKATVRDHAEYLSWLSASPKAGDRLKSWSCSWDKDEIDAPVERVVKVAAAPGRARVCQLEERVDGAITLIDTTLDGNSIRMRIGPMDLRREDEAMARRIDGGNVDIIESSVVALDENPGDPRRVNRMVLLATGLEDFVPLVDGRQKVEPVGSGRWRVTLERERGQGPDKPLDPAERAAMTRPTTTIQSADPKIVALAKNWAGGEGRPDVLAANLCRGVFKYLKKTLAANSEDALTILERREGDCTEHTLLFVAVARASGLPAREVGGLALGQNQGKPVLAWHAWPEFHDGSCWRAVDPTWNEPGGVDGTHWKLSIGERDSAWLNLMGRLKVTVERVDSR